MTNNMFREFYVFKFHFYIEFNCSKSHQCALARSLLTKQISPHRIIPHRIERSAWAIIVNKRYCAATMSRVELFEKYFPIVFIIPTSGTDITKLKIWTPP